MVALGCATRAGQLTTPKEPPPLPLLPAELSWEITLAESPAAGGAMDASRIYIPLASDQTVAVDRRTGSEVWHRDLATAWPPLAQGDQVYIAASEELHAIAAETGDPRWAVPMPRGAIGPMAFANDTLLVLTDPDEVWAIRPSDGNRLWRRELNGLAGPATLSVDRDAVFVTRANRILRLRLADGVPQWERTLSGTLTRPAPAGDRVVVGSTDDLFWALDARTGSVKWRRETGGDAIGAATDRDFVFLASLDNMMRAVNRDGHQQWRQKAAQTRPVGPPMAFGRIAVLVGISPLLSTFVAKTGVLVASYELEGGLMGPPLIDPTLVPFTVSIVLIGRDGQVRALIPRAMQFREQPLVPLPALPGRPLPRETPPP